MNSNKKDIGPGDIVAVGDIHGSYELMCKLVEHVRDTGCTLIFLGDLVDRGARDVECLALAKQLQEKPESFGISSSHCIMGNHEEMLVRACEGDARDHDHWVQNNGSALNKDQLCLFLPWIKTWPFVIMGEDTIFVHAGVIPGEDPYESIREGRHLSLMWIRQPFIVSGPQLHKWTSEYKRVIHGHTINEDRFGNIMLAPDISLEGDRIGIDTGACFSGCLTAYNSTQDTYISIIDEKITSP